MEIIDIYTRKQAIEDGYQMLLSDDLGQMAKQAGYKWPVYITNSVIGIIEKAIKNPHRDFKGVLWDILTCSRMTRLETLSANLIKFNTLINGQYQTFYMQAGSVDFDDPAPCLTLMIQEDL